MVFVRKVKVKNKEYFILVHPIRKGKKVTQKSKYIGKILPSKRKLEELKKEILDFLILPEEFRNKIQKDKEVLAVIIYGSYARGEKYRDIDISIVLNKKLSNIEMSKKRLKYISFMFEKFDIQVFQQLPLYIRKRILKEGKIIICKDEDALYNIAFSTIEEFESYKKIYYNYLEEMQK